MTNLTIDGKFCSRGHPTEAYLEIYNLWKPQTQTLPPPPQGCQQTYSDMDTVLGKKTQTSSPPASPLHMGGVHKPMRVRSCCQQTHLCARVLIPRSLTHCITFTLRHQLPWLPRADQSQEASAAPLLGWKCHDSTGHFRKWSRDKIPRALSCRYMEPPNWLMPLLPFLHTPLKDDSFWR